MELASTFEPDAAGFLDDRREAVGVGVLFVGGMENVDVLRASVLPSARARCILAVHGIAASGGHVDDQRIRATRSLNECVVDLGAHRATADDDHRAAWRTNLRWT